MLDVFIIEKIIEEERKKKYSEEHPFLEIHDWDEPPPEEDRILPDDPDRDKPERGIVIIE
jgi:hypothetical protein